MGVKYETHIFGPRFSETVLQELDPRFSRALAQFQPAETPLALGRVVMKNSDGTWAPLGSGEASGILITPLEASQEMQKGVVITGYAIINSEKLDFGEADKTTALSQLEQRGLVFKAIAEPMEEADGAEQTQAAESEPGAEQTQAAKNEPGAEQTQAAKNEPGAEQTQTNSAPAAEEPHAAE